MSYINRPVILLIFSTKIMQPAIVICLAAIVVAVSAYTRPMEPVEVYAIRPAAYPEPGAALGPVREKRSLLLAGAGLAGAGLLGAGLLGAGIAGAGLAGAGIAGAGLAGAGLGAGLGLAAGSVLLFYKNCL